MPVSYIVSRSDGATILFVLETYSLEYMCKVMLAMEYIVTYEDIANKKLQ